MKFSGLRKARYSGKIIQNEEAQRTNVETVQPAMDGGFIVSFIIFSSSRQNIE